MNRRIIAIVLLCAAVSCAAPTSQPTTRPQPSASLATTQPTAQKFPTPAELIAKLKEIEASKAKLSKVAYIDLRELVSEQPPQFSLFGSGARATLHDIIGRLHKARDDKSVRAVLVTLSADLQMNLAQAQEVRDALIELRRAGKKTFVYADSYDTTGYTIASGATNICLLEGGEIELPGVGLETMFYKGTFDKLGVVADFVQIGQYKGAEEPYTRSTPSDALRGELNKLTDSLYAEIVDGISVSRNMPSQTVKELIDDTMANGQVAKSRGFVDHLVDQDGLRKLIKDELGNDIDLVEDYGEPEEPQVDWSNPFSILKAMSQKPQDVSDKPAIAVIYASGVISDGDGQSGLFSSDGIASEAMRRTLRQVGRDDDVKALVIRINSPGGSALASEVMWQAVRHVSRDSHKPVIISVGNMAASGGYYLASAGDYIFADRCAIVGSIGVVGGKFVVKDLFDKLGLSTEVFSKGRNADLFGSNNEWDERQRRMVRTWMQQTYDQFTQRVMSTRGNKIKDIDAVAQGRIFLAPQAKELGMVDELGGCEAAITYAANKVGLKEGEYDVRTLPAPKTLADLLAGHDADALTPIQPKIQIDANSFLMA
ncbi:MAG TPA: signal peptide peptidase SppA, partial [Tepidisphaeraceae bacterium]